MEPSTKRHEEKWLVVFCDPPPFEDTASKREKLYRRVLFPLLKRHFRHVFVMRKAQNFKGYIVVQPEYLSMRVIEEPGLEFANRVVQMEQTGQAKVLSVVVDEREMQIPFWPMTCVSMVKRLIGKSSIAFTPYQLYRHLSATD